MPTGYYDTTGYLRITGEAVVSLVRMDGRRKFKVESEPGSLVERVRVMDRPVEQPEQFDLPEPPEVV